MRPFGVAKPQGVNSLPMGWRYQANLLHSVVFACDHNHQSIGYLLNIWQNSSAGVSNDRHFDCHKRPVAHKMFPFDDAIMITKEFRSDSSNTQGSFRIIFSGWHITFRMPLSIEYLTDASLSCSWGERPVTGGFPPQRASNAEIMLYRLIPVNVIPPHRSILAAHPHTMLANTVAPAP